MINNTEWFQIYIEWNRQDGYFRVGSGYNLGTNILISIDFYALDSPSTTINIDTIGIMHANGLTEVEDWNLITFQFIPTNKPKLCGTRSVESIAVKSWIDSDIATIWLKANGQGSETIQTNLSSSSVFNGPFESGDIISKSLTSVYEHDCIQLQAIFMDLTNGMFYIQYG